MKKKPFNSRMSMRLAMTETSRLTKHLIENLTPGTKIHDNRPLSPLQWGKDDYMKVQNYFWGQNKVKLARIARIAYGYKIMTGYDY